MFNDFDNIKDHFRNEELPFVQKVIEWVGSASTKHVTYLTDFVDPRQLEIIKSIVNSNMNLAVFFDGGYEDAERKRVLITPDYYIPEEEKDYLLSFFKVNGLNKFDKIEHKDVLGALLNLGLKRDKLGDIILSDNMIHIILAKEISDYIKFEFKKIKHTNIALEEIEKKDIIFPKNGYQISYLTASSLRVDTIISQACNISRTKSAQLIKNSKLKVNWRTIDSVEYTLKAGDIFSLRGYGRFKLINNLGMTKKGKYKLQVGKVI